MAFRSIYDIKGKKGFSNESSATYEITSNINGEYSASDTSNFKSWASSMTCREKFKYEEKGTETDTKITVENP